MDDFIKACSGTILGIAFIAIVVWVVVAIDNRNNSESVVQEQTFSEWVSPDGVHYWYKTGSYGESWLAPRIDNDGNFVIDK